MKKVLKIFFFTTVLINFFTLIPKKLSKCGKLNMLAKRLRTCWRNFPSWQNVLAQLAKYGKSARPKGQTCQELCQTFPNIGQIS
jgi:hypothetical protein